MITSIFGKTRPTNYILIGFVLLGLFILYHFFEKESISTFQNNISIGLIFLGLVFSIFVLDFIALKNNLTKLNNYSLLFFTVFLVLFSSVFKNSAVVIANFFLLLALRRLISLQSLRNPKEKIFDASFWIFTAALFHFWTILYIILVFVSIIFHVSGDYRNWLIPIIAFVAVFVMSLLADMIFLHGFLKNYFSDIAISFDFSYFENIYQNIALAIFSSIALLFFITQLFDLGNKPLNMQTSYKKVLFSFVLGVVIYILSNHKNNSFLLYTFAPLAILTTNYMERIKTNWMREISMYLMVGIALLIFLIQL